MSEAQKKSLVQFRKGSRFAFIPLVLAKKRHFLMVIGLSFLIAGAFYPYPSIAMWIGFVFAGYSAIASDSIQTIGTFIASNAQRKWWQLWLYIGLIFIVTVGISWVVFEGDVSYQRLSTISTVPMSTTWVFIGLLAGRELAIKIRQNPTDLPQTARMIGKDLLFTSIGLILSIAIAAAVNPIVYHELQTYLKSWY